MINVNQHRLIQSLFRPATNLMGRLDFSKRSALIGFLLLSAIFVVIYNLYTSLQHTIVTSKLELDGTSMIKPLSRTLQLVQLHRGLSIATLTGSEVLKEQRITIEKETVVAFDTLQKSLPAKITSSTEWKSINDDWIIIRKEGLNWSVRDNFEAHTKLVYKLITIEGVVVDEYDLSADPQIDTYHLINSISSELPQALERLGQLRAYGSGILNKKQISEAQKIQLNVLVGEFKNALYNFTTGLDKTNHFNSTIPNSRSLNSNHFSMAAQYTINNINSEVISSQFEVTPEDYFLKSKAAIDAGYEQIYQTLTPKLQQLLKTRIQQAEFTLRLSTSIALLLFLIVIYLTIAIYLVTKKSILRLVASAHIFATGDLQERVNLDTHDELVLVGHSFNKMADSIQKLHEEQRLNEMHLKAVIDNTPICVKIVASNGSLLEMNPAGLVMIGAKSPTDAIGKSVYDLISPKDRDAYRKFNELICTNKSGAMQFEITALDGNKREMETYSAPIRFKSTGELVQLAVTQDISERKHAEDKMKLAASVFVNAREGILITDATGRIVEVNDTFSLISGYTRDEVLGENPRIFQSGLQSPEFYDKMWQAITTTGQWIGEIWNRRKNGEVYAEILTISAVHDTAGQVQNYVALFTDITAIKEQQSRLERIAHYDILTNLPNRVLLADRLGQAMVQCQRHQQSLVVAFLDLDGFKAVNDAHGHDVGDELLITLSQLMKEAMREGDTLARIGGDEFVAILAGLAKTEDCQPVLKRLLKAAATPVNISGIILSVSASIGVTIYPQDAADVDQLMRHADQAMYTAKQAGKNRYHLFDTAQNDAVKIQQESIGDICFALDRHEFVLHYQPKVNMRTGEVIGVEALIRWQHPVRGLVSPLSFLPLIEGHVVSLDLGEWIIDTALKQISQWQSMGSHLPISVNISAYQLQQDNFATRLAALLADHPEVNPRCLELEVLETSALSDLMQASGTMQACSNLGVRFALDDFGTGYSSLTYLRRLPVHLIKIDQSFVHDMLIDPNDLAIVQGVVGLAKSFQREVIAEGVETIAHGAALLQLGCDFAQGYGIARPMPASDIPEWVVNWRPDSSWLP
ncbi:MAG: EAL domain-containing protein [Methylotenera sp.]|uniref:EAL domain-containing protein n=1 Tax=Methylotenera sp. TaxID=2051956 RepID=UPI002489CE80|nr:EAL domain-containing protein [Methylotenera sp.]MDI1310449.1 EAL domain-containing protein [Methylotenera sp.]